MTDAKWFRAEIGLRAALTVAGRGLLPRRAAPRPTDLFLCVADHFEPRVGGVAPAVARARLEDWLCRYPAVAAAARRDADGRPPAHTFFYPWDEYDDGEMRRLTDLCGCADGGCGEIEIHLHHRDDTSDSLRAKLREAVRAYRRHGALSAWPDGRPAWGFVHGNWALDNARAGEAAGGGDFCGVNDELTVLAEEGCYADFTFPAWPHTAQPRQTNSIFYARDDPARPKSYDTGAPARATPPPPRRRAPSEGAPPRLLIVQGPLVPHLAPALAGGPGRRGRGGRGWRVAVDDGDLAGSRRYYPSRLDRWVRAGIHVLGRPDRLFVKLHCHGAADANRDILLGEDLPALFADAAARYNDGARWRLHYVTAREMYNVIRATEAAGAASSENRGGDYAPGLRDWLLPLPSPERAAAAR